MAISTFPPASTGGTPLSQKVVRITSTQTWNCPADVTGVQVVVVSGGGGGGGHDNASNPACGGGGGGGGYVEEFLTVVPSTAYTITIGAGGSGGGAGTDGTQGGTSSFGALLSVTGGGFGSRPGQTPNITTAACGGGQGFSNTGGESAAGHGGGMGSISWGPGGNSSRALFSTWQAGTIGYPGTNGGSSVSILWNSVGINGYAGGGCGGYGLPNNSSGPPAIPSIRISGAGWGATVTSNVNSAAGSGAANSGGGGGGAARNNSFSQAAGAGGSGIVIISYWSAL